MSASKLWLRSRRKSVKLCHLQSQSLWISLRPHAFFQRVHALRTHIWLRIAADEFGFGGGRRGEGEEGWETTKKEKKKRQKKNKEKQKKTKWKKKKTDSEGETQTPNWLLVWEERGGVTPLLSPPFLSSSRPSQTSVGGSMHWFEFLSLLRSTLFLVQTR